jgi:hypothetical protein
VRCTTGSCTASKNEDKMQAQLDLRLSLRLTDQVAKSAEPDICRLAGDLE